jgi:hypothetical protein
VTDSIDLDEMDVGEDEAETEQPNHGDWLWRGEGDPDEEADPQWDASRSAASAEAADESDRSTPRDANEPTEASAEEPADERRTPKVPGAPDGPVGVPETRGGAGGGKSSSNGQPQEAAADPDRTTSHGEAGDADEMTLALTYEAINRLEDPQVVIADARGWADWIGIVGKVSTPAIRKFQRDERIDLDFFGGSETGPAQRLADITPESMFYAERMVVVGAKNDERIAETAGWEFIPLETAAEKAGWNVEHAE